MTSSLSAGQPWGPAAPGSWRRTPTSKARSVEPDPTFSKAQTGASNNCMRQQFANPINVRIGQFAAEFVKTFREELGGDPAVPELAIRNFGYLYLSDNLALTAVLERDQKVQAENGAGTRMIGREEIAAAYPFYRLDDIEAGSLNTRDEGYYDAPLMVEWLIRKSIERGVDYLRNRVVSIARDGDKVTSVTLETGEVIAAGHIVNAAGTRAPRGASHPFVRQLSRPRPRMGSATRLSTIGPACRSTGRSRGSGIRPAPGQKGR